MMCMRIKRVVCVIGVLLAAAPAFPYATTFGVNPDGSLNFEQLLAFRPQYDVPGTTPETPPDFLFGQCEPDGTGSVWDDDSMDLFVTDDGSGHLTVYWVYQLVDGSFPIEELIGSDPDAFFATYYPDGVGGPLNVDALYAAFQVPWADPMVVEYESLDIPELDVISETEALTISETRSAVRFPFQGGWSVGYRIERTSLLTIEVLFPDLPPLDPPLETVTNQMSRFQAKQYVTTLQAATAHAELLASVGPHSPCRDHVHQSHAMGDGTRVLTVTQGDLSWSVATRDKNGAWGLWSGPAPQTEAEANNLAGNIANGSIPWGDVRPTPLSPWHEHCLERALHAFDDPISERGGGRTPSAAECNADLKIKARRCQINRNNAQSRCKSDFTTHAIGSAAVAVACCIGAGAFCGPLCCIGAAIVCGGATATPSSSVYESCMDTASENHSLCMRNALEAWASCCAASGEACIVW